jgi:hypothetical protein
VQDAGKLDVVNEATASGQQRRIFKARDAGAEMPRAHGQMSRSSATRRLTIH